MSMMTEVEGVQKEYVEPSAHDMRRSRHVNADMVSKLAKQEEEIKEGKKRGSIRGDFRNRQSVLLTSFAPMRPIVTTKESTTQTELDPLK